MELAKWGSLMYNLLAFIGIAVIHIIESIVLTFIPRRYRAKSIKGEIALITGAAGGIGSLIAERLAKLGAHVVIWDINKSGMEETVRRIRDNGGTCWSYHCDITDREEVYKVAKTVQIEVGSVTLLINNAGYVYGKTLMELPDDEIERTYRVNILSHYWITKSFMRDMMKNNHGHIVTISSMTGYLGTYNCTDYSATKFAAIGYHESLFTELKAQGYNGIHMTLVCPYAINTGMFQGIKPRVMPMLTPEYVADEVVLGILVNEAFILLPKFVRLLIPLKFLFPAKSYWTFMADVMEAPQSMMTLREKEMNETLKNNNTTIPSKETYVH